MPDKHDDKVRLHLLSSLRNSSAYRGLFRSDKLLHMLRRNDNLHLSITCYVRFRRKSPYLSSDTEALLLHAARYMHVHIFRREHNGSYREESVDYPPVDGIPLYAFSDVLSSVRCTVSTSAIHSFRTSDM